MVPVVTAGGRPVVLPTPPWRKFGYSHEFDANGRTGDLRVDFAAVAAHLGALDAAANANGLRIARVILAPEFERRIRRDSRYGQRIGGLPFMNSKPWVRHDEHYHVDFDIGGA